MSAGIILFCDRPKCTAQFVKRTGSMTVALSAAEGAGWSTPRKAETQLAYCPRHQQRLGYRGAPILPAGARS